MMTVRRLCGECLNTEVKCDECHIGGMYVVKETLSGLYFAVSDGEPYWTEKLHEARAFTEGDAWIMMRKEKARQVSVVRKLTEKFNERYRTECSV